VGPYCTVIAIGVMQIPRKYRASLVPGTKIDIKIGHRILSFSVVPISVSYLQQGKRCLKLKIAKAQG